MINKITISVLGFLLALLAVGCGSDGGAEGQAFWQSIVGSVVEIVVVVATPLLLLLARKVVRVVEDKTKISLSDQQEMMLESWVEKGIAYAHEQGRKALKENKKPLKGDEKKIAAVDFIESALKSTGLINLGRDKLEQLVEAKLNMQREEDDRVKPKS